MDSQCTKLIDAMKRGKSIDGLGDIEVGEDVGYLEHGDTADDFKIQPTLGLKALDELNCSNISSSSWSCQIALKELLIRLPEESVTNESPVVQNSAHFHLLSRLPSSTNQLQGLELLLEDSEIVKPDANNNGGSTSLDILEEAEIENINHKHKAADLNNKHQVGKQNGYRSEILLMDRYHALLLAATLLAAMTFHAALRSPAIFSQNQTQLPKRDYDQMNHLFILFNSVAFFASVALITLLTYQLPLKPWLQIVVFSTFGAYICAIMAVSPQEVVTVILVGNFIWFAALFKYLGLDQNLARLVQWIFPRIGVI